MIDIELNSRYVKNLVRGAHFYSSSKISFTVERREPVACVVDRAALDNYLAEKAIDCGAKVLLGHKVQYTKKSKDNIVAGGSWGNIEAELMIDAEGVAPKFLENNGLKPLKRKNLIPALQLDLSDTAVDTDYVEVYMDRHRTPRFFSWIIPTGRNSVRAGLACKEKIRQKLESFVIERFGEKIVGQIKGPARPGFISTHGPIRKTSSDRMLVVGDAAGQTKPTTGGGVILGGICSKIAGEIAYEAVRKKEFSGSLLQKYDLLWKKRLAKEFKAARLFRRIVDRLSEKSVDDLFRIIIERNLEKEISQIGDIDFQARSIFHILRKRDIAKILSSILKGFVFR
jgi:flavin-dependent dehydrogenase